MIHRLAPSLRPHIGCSIIDLNPGPALWSSKLHDFLRPRSHVLVEPESVYHEPFLRPLLDVPGSRYHLRDWGLKDAFDLHRYISEGLITLPRGSDNTDDPSTHRNNSILVIANITRGARTKSGREQNESLFRTQAFLSSVQRMDGLNVQGPVRMLMWLPEAEKQSMLPRTVFHRLRIALTLETYFHVEEIVTGPKQPRQRRQISLDIESGKRVARRMRAAGMEIPRERQDETQMMVQKLLAGSANEETTRLQDTPREWKKELEQLEEALANNEFAKFHPPDDVGTLPESKKFPSTNSGLMIPQFGRLQRLRENSNFVNKKRLALDRFLALEAEIDALDIDILHGGLDTRHRETRKIQRDELYRSLKTRLIDQTVQFPSELAFHSDDKRAFALNPPLLMWDRRNAEPILAQEDEFMVQKPISLLDFQPLVPSPYPMTMEQTIYFDHISRNLFHHGSNTVRYLNSVAPGAFEALAPLVPSLADPLKGGRANMDDLRVRSLTPEMVHGLALAWERWSFKPDFLEVVARDSRLAHLLDHNAKTGIAAFSALLSGDTALGRRPR